MAWTNVNKEELERLLKTNTSQQTAKILGVSLATICRAKKIYNIKRTYRELIDAIEIPEESLQIMYGSLLGDGYVQYNSNKNFEAYYRAEQSIQQKEYLFWKYDNLKFLCSGEPRLCQRKYPSYYFQTRCHKDITTLYSMFYKNGIKIIPDNFEEYINPVSLMTWFLDDGTNRKNQIGAELCVQGFTRIEIGRIISTLKIKFKIDCKPKIVLVKQLGKPTVNISFGKEGTLALFDLIQPLVKVESMKYKVYPRNDYVPNPD